MLAAGISLLVAAWIVATVPFGAPDEASHFERAVGLSRGVVLGPHAVYGPTPVETPIQEAFLNHDTRGVRIPTSLIPPGQVCLKRTRTRSGCTVASPNGNFQPLGYVLPAVAIRATSHAGRALWLARAAGAIQSVAFLLLAAALLWSGSGWSLLGFLAAVSPMVLFTSSIMNPSGIQVASCLAFVAGLLRLARAPRPATEPRWVWVSAVISGLVGMLTGPAGLVFVVADLVLFAALLLPTRLRELAGERRARIAGAVLLAGAIVSVAYTKIAGFATDFGITPFRESLHGGYDQLSPMLKGAVGDFGALTVQLPAIAVYLWLALVAVLVARALWLGRLRERVTMVVVIALVAAFPVLFWAWIDRYSGFGLEAREILPVLMLVPVLAGELVFLHTDEWRQRGGARVALWTFATVIAGFQGYAWWYSARAAASTSRSVWFVSHATWSPPLGWWPWIAAALLGTLALLTFAIVESLRPARLDREPATVTPRPSDELTVASR